MKILPINNLNFKSVIKVQTNLKNTKSRDFFELNKVLNGDNSQIYSKEEQNKMKAFLSSITDNNDKGMRFEQLADTSDYFVSGQDAAKTMNIKNQKLHKKALSGSLIELTFEAQNNGYNKLKHIQYENMKKTYHADNDGFCLDKESANYFPNCYQHIYYSKLEADI